MVGLAISTATVAVLDNAIGSIMRPAKLSAANCGALGMVYAVAASSCPKAYTLAVCMPLAPPVAPNQGGHHITHRNEFICCVHMNSVYSCIVVIYVARLAGTTLVTNTPSLKSAVSL